MEIDCPEDCVYLTGAHAAAWDGRETERRRDLRHLVPHIERLSEPQAELFFAMVARSAGIHARRPEVDDRLLEQAVIALRRTADTREQGLIYEHAAEDLRAQTLVGDLREAFQPGQGSEAHGPKDGDLRAAFAALEAALTQVIGEAKGPRAFLELAGRVVERMGAAPSRPGGAPPLIVEP